MITRVELKSRARDIAFKNKWNIWKPVLLYFLLSFFIVILFGGPGETGSSQANVDDSVLSVFQFLTAFLLIGFYKYLLCIIREEEFSLATIWNFRTMFGGAMLIMIFITVFTFLWLLLFIIPGIVASLSYSMSFYLKADNENIYPLDAIKKSKQMMRGHKLEYFILGLSFIGWFLLSIITLGIALIWFVPYSQITFALYYDELRKLD